MHVCQPWRYVCLATSQIRKIVIKMKCAVHNCSNKFKAKQKHSQQFSFFSFPKNPDILKEWISFCRKNNKDKQRKTYLKSVICNEHFKDEDIQGGLQFQMGLFTVSNHAIIKNIYNHFNLRIRTLYKENTPPWRSTMH